MKGGSAGSGVSKANDSVVSNQHRPLSLLTDDRTFLCDGSALEPTSIEAPKMLEEEFVSVLGKIDLRIRLE